MKAKPIEWWEAQYDAHARAVLTFASLAGAAAPEDVLGEAFVAVARRIDTIDADHLRSELLRSALDALRRDGAPQATVLAALDVDERAAVILRIGFGMPLADAARVIGVTDDAARQLVASAHARLVRSLAVSLPAR